MNKNNRVFLELHRLLCNFIESYTPNEGKNIEYLVMQANEPTINLDPDSKRSFDNIYDFMHKNFSEYFCTEEDYDEIGKTTDYLIREYLKLKGEYKTKDIHFLKELLERNLIYEQITYILQLSNIIYDRPSISSFKYFDIGTISMLLEETDVSFDWFAEEINSRRKLWNAKEINKDSCFIRINIKSQEATSRTKEGEAKMTAEDIVDTLTFLASLRTNTKSYQSVISITSFFGPQYPLVVSLTGSKLQAGTQRIGLLHQAILNDELYSYFNNDTSKKLIKLIVNKVRNEKKLETNLYNSIKWFSHGEREINKMISFFAYMNVFESLFNLSYNDRSIADLISENAAFTLSGDFNVRKNIKKRVKDYYSIRSRIAHGKIKSISREEIAMIRHDAKESILKYLEFIEQNKSKKGLSDRFDDLRLGCKEDKQSEVI